MANNDDKPQIKANDVENLTLSDKKKWLEGAFVKKQSDKQKNTSPTTKKFSNETAGFFEDKGRKKDPEEKTPLKPAPQGLATERNISLEEETHKDPIQENMEGTDDSENVAGRKKWLHGDTMEKKEEKKPGNEMESLDVKKLSTQFGGVKSAVRKRKEELERKQQEEAKKNDPKSYQKVSWKSKGSSPGQFKKVIEDSRGIAPKRSLDDLP